LAYETELQVNRLLPPDLIIRAAPLLYSGSLLAGGSGWAWPYLIYDYLPGFSIGEVYEQVSFADQFTLAGNLGEATRQMQQVSLKDAPLFSKGLDAYARFLQDQRSGCLSRHRQWQCLPDHLIDQLEDYLLPVDSLADPLIPHGLIHADITRDHILGRLEADRWVTLGLIDFGDARVGNVFYDLGALHIDLFWCDKRLLRAYLEAFGLQDRRQFAHKAMSTVLLHEFSVLSILMEMYPQYREVATLGYLAEMIWNIEA
jgi:hygromycin-B 7''-O-kinase